MGRRLFSAVNLLSLVLLGVVNLKIASADESSAAPAAVTTTAASSPKTNKPDIPVTICSPTRNDNETHKVNAGDSLRMESNINCSSRSGKEVIEWGFLKLGSTTPNDAELLFIGGMPYNDRVSKKFVYDNETNAIILQSMTEDDQGLYGCSIGNFLGAGHIVYYNQAGANYAQVGCLLMLITTIVKFIV